MLIVDKITKSIQAKEIVKDCSLSVQAGQICGLAGPNGAGKTTLLNLLAGFIQPTSGELSYNSVPAAAVNEQALRRRLSLVMQKPYLFSGTLRENLLLGAPERTDLGYPAAPLCQDRNIKNEYDYRR